MFWLILLICNTLLWFGLIGNICSTVIFVRSKYRAFFSSIILLALSSMHLGYILVAIPVHIYLTINFFFPSYYSSTIYHYTIYSHPISAMFQYCASWLLVTITIEKYIEICHPFTYEKYCTRKIVVGIVVCNILSAIAYNFIRFWEFERYDETTKRKIILLRYDDVYVVYRDYISVFVQAIMPFAVIITLNILIARRTNELDYNGRHLNDHEKVSHEIAKIVRYIGIVFLACHTLPTIINIIEVIDRVWLVQHTSALVYDIYILLMFINTLSVFVLFAVFAVPFRSELRTIWQSVSCLRFSGTLSLPNVIKSSFKRQNGDGQAGEASYDPQNLTPQPPNAEAHM